jgi:3-dehydroquinate dehydratase/shikimate dehydrogenase
MVELRLDGVTDIDVAGALEGRSKPVIVTCRPTWEGGRFDGSEEARLRILSDAARLGAEFVDIEWSIERAKWPRGERTKIVLSSHDFDGIPADLTDRLQTMLQKGADVVKVAVTPSRLADSLTLRDAVRGIQNIVAIVMGPKGALSRICPWLFGSRWTYCGQAAPGQTQLRELVDTYHVRRTSTSSAIYAVTGAPLSHSASPAMHNAALAAAGLDAVYVPLETDDAQDLIAVAEGIGVKGVSVTAPLKRALVATGAPGDELGQRIGAINTLRRKGDGWESRNFDVAGFLAPFEHRSVRLAGRRVVVLGAGGAARAAVFALAAHGARVEIAARRTEQGEALAREFHARAVAWPPEPGWDVLVNTTPVGTWPRVDASPLDRELVRGGLVYDLVYNPIETTLLKWARAAGAETIGGLEMLVAQARLQFEWWTGVPASLAAVERGALEFLSREPVTA